LRSPLAAVFLSDADPAVVREAARAIHDDLSIPEALPVLAALLDQRTLPTDEAVARRALNANLRVGDETSARRLLRFATATAPAEPLRVEAVDCLGAWNDRPYLDRVEGLVRPLAEREPDLGNQLIRTNLAVLLGSGNGALARAVTRILARNQIATELGVFAEWV